jgi:transposase InsO family protein
MIAIVKLLIWGLLDCFKSRGRLEAEVIVLRHQINILRRRVRKRVRPSAFDRAIFVWLYRLFPDISTAVAIIRPETVVRWHRMGFRAWWRWKSRNRGGRPMIDRELRDLVRRMCEENPLWGAPRIHGELLKLGFDVAQSTVSKYMLRRRGPPSQGWKTFLRNHADGIASVDFLIVPTLTFQRLFAFVILGLGRRRLLWIGVTTNPTAEWLARQITEAFPWNTVPTFLIRDNDGAYGEVFTRRLRAMGIRDRPIAPRSPWQNGYVERAIGSIRRECLDHVIVVGEAHLRRILAAYIEYYNAVRTHLGIAKDAPDRRPIERCGAIIAVPALGGLHHRYARI